MVIELLLNVIHPLVNPIETPQRDEDWSKMES